MHQYAPNPGCYISYNNEIHSYEPVCLTIFCISKGTIKHAAIHQYVTVGPIILCGIRVKIRHTALHQYEPECSTSL
jgi:hypothetical protein